METIEKETAFIKHTAYKPYNSAKNWIGGKWVDAERKGISLNPATGEQIGLYADGDEKEAQLAVVAAVRSFNETSWKKDYGLRSKVILALADKMEERSKELIELLCTESGKIVPEATMEVYAAPAFLRYWAGKTFTAGRSGEAKPGSLSLTLREAIGVAGIIVPFNAPVALSMRALAPVLAAGTATVVKLPGVTAQLNELLCRIISEVPDLPEGIINVITESGDEAAKFLVQSPDVPVISFTGSTKTGKAIAAAGAMQLKRLSLELGGKTPMIIFNDADLQTAIFTMEKSVTIFSGQFCMTGSRILVQKDVAEQVKKELASRLSNVIVGPPSDPTSEMGSMIDKANVQRVNNMVIEAIASGAAVIVRGGPVAEEPLSKGAFYRPTLLEVSGTGLPIVRQEIFGPVAVLQVFETEQEVIALANNSEYGLAASIWTRDVDRPWRVAQALEAGTIWINAYAQIFPQFEEGGYKHSGVGRLNGEAALEAFLEYKHISFNPGAIT